MAWKTQRENGVISSWFALSISRVAKLSVTRSGTILQISSTVSCSWAASLPPPLVSQLHVTLSVRTQLTQTMDLLVWPVFVHPLCWWEWCQQVQGCWESGGFWDPSVQMEIDVSFPFLQGFATAGYTGWLHLGCGMFNLLAFFNFLLLYTLILFFFSLLWNKKCFGCSKRCGFGCSYLSAGKRFELHSYCTWNFSRIRSSSHVFVLFLKELI